MARQSQWDADAERPELLAADADARGPRCPRALSEPAAVGRPDARARSVSWAVRSSEHPPASELQWALAAELKEWLKPEVLLPRQRVPQPVLLLLAPSPRDGDASRHPLQVPARASLRQKERQSRLRAADESRPAERQHVRASRAPNGRGCEQPDRRSADSDGCGRVRPFDEGD